MKKIAAAFLLVIFLFNTAGYFIAFKAVRYQIKKEIQSEIKLGLKPSELTAITIDKGKLDKLDWLENGKEMYYKGELYDIVKSSENTTSITYYCIDDNQEESLFAHMDEHINMHIAANKPLKNENGKNLSNSVIKLYFTNAKLISFPVFSSNNLFFSFPLIYNSVIIDVISPPPQLS